MSVNSEATTFVVRREWDEAQRQRGFSIFADDIPPRLVDAALRAIDVASDDVHKFHFSWDGRELLMRAEGTSLWVSVSEESLNPSNDWVCGKLYEVGDNIAYCLSPHTDEPEARLRDEYEVWQLRGVYRDERAQRFFRFGPLLIDRVWLDDQSQKDMAAWIYEHVIRKGETATFQGQYHFAINEVESGELSHKPEDLPNAREFAGEYFSVK